MEKEKKHSNLYYIIKENMKNLTIPPETHEKLVEKMKEKKLTGR